MMEATRIVHAERVPGDGWCGASRVETTMLRGDVTCRVCRSLMPEDDGVPIGEERVVERGAHELTVREARIVQRSLHGDDSDGPRCRWSSLEAAEEQYVRIVDDGTPIRSSFRAEVPVQGGSPMSRSSGREEVIVMDQALEQAFTQPRTFRDVTLSPADQRRIYELVRFGRVEIARTAPGRKGTIKRRTQATATEVAECDLGGRLTAHEVGLVVRAGRRAMRDYLETRDELPKRRAREEDGDAMAMPKGWKGYEGWKGIADALGVAISTAEELVNRPADANPLPAIKYLGRVILRHDDLIAWTDQEVALEVARAAERRARRPTKQASGENGQLNLAGLTGDGGASAETE